MNPVIDHLNRYVSDIEAHITFYTKILGYELIDRGFKTDKSEYAILRGYSHEFFISEKKGFIADDKNFRHIGYSIENINSMKIKLLAMGYTEEYLKIIEKPYSKQIYLKDPDGFEIDLIQWTDKDKFYDDLKSKDRKQ